MESGSAFSASVGTVTGAVARITGDAFATNIVFWSTGTPLVVEGVLVGTSSTNVAVAGGAFSVGLVPGPYEGRMGRSDVFRFTVPGTGTYNLSELVTNVWGTNESQVFEVVARKGVAGGYAGLGTNGLVGTGRLGTGTADGTKILHGDQAWREPASQPASGVLTNLAGTGALTNLNGLAVGTQTLGTNGGGLAISSSGAAHTFALDATLQAWAAIGTNALTDKLASNVWQNSWGQLGTNALTEKLASNVYQNAWGGLGTNSLTAKASTTELNSASNTLSGDIAGKQAGSEVLTNLAATGAITNVDTTQFATTTGTAVLKDGVMTTNLYRFNDSRGGALVVTQGLVGPYDFEGLDMHYNEPTLTVYIEAISRLTGNKYRDMVVAASNVVLSPKHNGRVIIDTSGATVPHDAFGTNSLYVWGNATINGTLDLIGAPPVLVAGGMLSHNGTLNVSNVLATNLVVREQTLTASNVARLDTVTNIANAQAALVANSLTNALAPIGSITAWAKNLTGVPALAANWVECNGQTLSDAGSPLNGQVIPDLNGGQRFLRGFSASGGTGGSTNHDHTASVAIGQVDVTDPTWGVVSSVWVDATNTVPPFYGVVWIMRVK